MKTRDGKSDFGQFPDGESRVKAFKLNLRTLAGIRAIVKLVHCSTHTAAVQMAVESFLQHLPSLFPLITPEKIEAAMAEEVKFLVEEEKKGPGRPRKKKT